MDEMNDTKRSSTNGGLAEECVGSIAGPLSGVRSQ